MLDGTNFMIPVAPRWSIRPKLETGSLELAVDDHALVQLPTGSLPGEWVDCAFEAGMVVVVAGPGMNLAADHPADAVRPASEHGLACGALVLVQTGTD